MSAHAKGALRKSVIKLTKQPRGASEAERKKHQNDLLDDGLRETFPASDPVSVMRVE